MEVLQTVISASWPLQGNTLSGMPFLRQNPLMALVFRSVLQQYLQQHVLKQMFFDIFVIPGFKAANVENKIFTFGFSAEDCRWASVRVVSMYLVGCMVFLLTVLVVGLILVMSPRLQKSSIIFFVSCGRASFLFFVPRQLSSLFSWHFRRNFLLTFKSRCSWKCRPLCCLHFSSRVFTRVIFFLLITLALDLHRLLIPSLIVWWVWAAAVRFWTESGDRTWIPNISKAGERRFCWLKTLTHCCVFSWRVWHWQCCFLNSLPFCAACPVAHWCFLQAFRRGVLCRGCHSNLCLSSFIPVPLFYGSLLVCRQTGPVLFLAKAVFLTTAVCCPSCGRFFLLCSVAIQLLFLSKFPQTLICLYPQFCLLTGWQTVLLMLSVFFCSFCCSSFVDCTFAGPFSVCPDKDVGAKQQVKCHRGGGVGWFGTATSCVDSPPANSKSPWNSRSVWHFHGSLD